MRPSAAELARTLISGPGAATVRLACRPGRLSVRHATDCAGRPLLLARLDDPLVQALAKGRPPTIVLQAADEPPSPDAPSLGRVLVGGTAAPVPPERQREAVLEFAETRPDPDLFDVGRGVVLFQVEVREIRLVPGDQSARPLWPVNRSPLPGDTPSTVVDLDAYLAADPDPLYASERDLLADLNDHHGARLGPYLAGRLAAAGMPAVRPVAIRLDRYGMLVAPYTGCRTDPVRVSFARAVRDRADLARLLHPVLFHR